jgi:lysozyme family protein
LFFRTGAVEQRHPTLRPKADRVKSFTENGKLKPANESVMATTFDKCLKLVFAAEGGFSDNPADRGGSTNFGISSAFLESIGSDKTPEELTQDEARELYQHYFWTPVQGDDLPPPVALVIFDMAVNSGVKTAVRRLQYVLNNYQGADLDGVMGPRTLSAAQIAYHLYNKIFLGELLNSRREYYADLIRKNPSQGVFARGWNNRLNKLLTEMLSNNWT